MNMRDLVTKICMVLLFAACLILTIDKTRISLKFEGITSRISEKSREIRELETFRKTQVKNLEKIIAEKDRIFRFHLYSEQMTDTVSFIQKALPDSREERIAVSLAENLKTRSPVELKRAVQKVFQEKYEGKDSFSFDAEHGYLQSRFATVTEETARRAGLIAHTVFSWEMPSCRLHADTLVTPRNALEKLPVHISDGQTEDAASLFIRQDRAESVIFPFTLSLSAHAPELYVLQEPGLLPVGGYYAHFFQVQSEQVWLLDYEFSGEQIPAGMNLRAVSFQTGAPVQSAVSGNIVTFQITPLKGNSMILVIADKPAFPVKISAIRRDRVFPPDSTVKLKK